ncbi:hypothetical protein MKR36_08140 [Staphylococcus haemolyticus]|uniref:hypothetical protein n=1 Tax=Staphylococcus haemolyticus TaxID=1283 RepID=UPI001F0A0E5D|nr:hypothetical protein [Staphylococcus haemolyticus]MCH4404046.1 hypothetical protein [Staphylococcus haemolyticus]
MNYLSILKQNTKNFIKKNKTILFLLFVIGIILYNFDVLGNYIEGIFTLLGAYIAVRGVEKTINSNKELKNRELLKNQELKNQELLNSLDQKSEWRKELMNIAAKPVIQLEDVYRILASLRFLPKDENEVKQSEQKDFDKISTYIYKKLIEKINDFYKDNNIKLDETLKEDFLKYRFNIRNSEEIRQYVKFLLKHHWEYNQSNEDKKEFMNKEKREFERVRAQIDQIGESGTFASTFKKFEGFEDFEPIEEKIYIKEYRDKKYKNINKKIGAFLQKNKNDITITNIKINKNYCEKIIEIKYKRY